MRGWTPGAKATFRASVLIFVSFLAIGQQCFEIYYVLLSHFHYTSDVIVALMLTFLFYSNGAISIFAKQWALRDFHFLSGGHFLPRFYFHNEPPKSEGFFRVWKELLCPSRAQTTYVLQYWDYENKSGENKSGQPQLEEMQEEQNKCCCGKCVYSWHRQIENPPYPGSDDSEEVKDKALQNMWVSRGDIFVPVCCFPCCCLAGRQHVWSDQGVDSVRHLINRDEDESNDIGDEVVEQMHMHEGINEMDMHSIRKAVKHWRSGTEPTKEQKDRHISQIKTRSVNPWAFKYVKDLVHKRELKNQGEATASPEKSK